MSNLHSQLRVDSPNALPFLMIRHPPSSQERQSRAAEWVLATWMGLMDSSIMGVRRVDDEKNGQVLPMVHIAIPLAYQRKQLAETLELEQIKDEQNTPRVNLSSSVGFAEPHSFIRVPLEIVLDRFFDFMLTARKVVEINDQTLSKPEDIVEEFFREVREERRDEAIQGNARDPKQRRREEDAQLRMAVQLGLARRKAAIDPAHIEILVDRHTRERWVRIRNVGKNDRTVVKLAIKQAGVHTAVPSRNDGNGAEWVILFSAVEARKLML